MASTKNFPILNNLELFWVSNLYRSTIKSPMNRGVISDFGLFEHCCDYIFRYLGFKDSALDCDIMISETLNTPLETRKSTMELLFECYGAVRVLPIVGALVDNFEAFS